MNKRLILLLAVLFVVLQIIACRFTVREIGFSTLSHNIYSLFVIDSNANPEDQEFKDIRTILKDSNIKFVVLNPETDKTHPAVLAAVRDGISFPATFLMSPDGKTLLFENSSLKSIADELLYSPVRTYLSQNFYKSFAFILFIESSDNELNKLAGDALQNDCDDIYNRIPNMPKQVDLGPVVIKIKVSDFEQERILLWAIGIDSVPDTPKALVMYGRGRIIGDIIDYDEIVNNRAFRLMAMIGADCECGLDRKWMLGKQIPINWPVQVKQSLADELGFDVDNPMVMAEMSHILQQDPISDQNPSISFAPEEFDLDNLFAKSDQSDRDDLVNQSKQSFNPLLVVLLVSVFILLVGSFVFIRKKK